MSILNNHETDSCMFRIPFLSGAFEETFRVVAKAKDDWAAYEAIADERGCIFFIDMQRSGGTKYVPRWERTLYTSMYGSSAIEHLAIIGKNMVAVSYDNFVTIYEAVDLGMGYTGCAWIPTDLDLPSDVQGMDWIRISDHPVDGQLRIGTSTRTFRAFRQRSLWDRLFRRRGRWSLKVTG
jgi:hypothetical protein